MAGGFAPDIDGADLRRQLCDYLRLLELSGVKEIALEEAAHSRGAETCQAPDLPSSGTDGQAAGIETLRLEAEACRACCLHKGRTKVVFGEGNPSGRLMFIGEGPGADEDREGRPFVGRAGMLLTRIIDAMGLARQDVYIANVVKCRPPGNRVPEPDEIASCLPYLEKQIDLVGPEAICTLGNVATHTVTGEHRPVSEMRWKTYEYRGIKVFPTYHPAACLRNPESKKLVWEDIKKVMRQLDLPIRGVKRNGPGTNGN